MQITLDQFKSNQVIWDDSDECLCLSNRHRLCVPYFHCTTTVTITEEKKFYIDSYYDHDHKKYESNFYYVYPNTFGIMVGHDRPFLSLRESVTSANRLGFEDFHASSCRQFRKLYFTFADADIFENQKPLFEGNVTKGR